MLFSIGKHPHLVAICPRCEQVKTARRASHELRHCVHITTQAHDALLPPLPAPKLPLCVAVAVLFCSGQDGFDSGAAVGATDADVANVKVEALLRRVFAVAKAKVALGTKGSLEKLGALHVGCD